LDYQDEGDKDPWLDRLAVPHNGLDTWDDSDWISDADLRDLVTEIFTIPPTEPEPLRPAGARKERLRRKSGMGKGMSGYCGKMQSMSGQSVPLNGVENGLAKSAWSKAMYQGQAN
jgi:hypothetical protein